MQVYQAPMRDMQFVLRELHDFESLTSLPAFTDFSAELIDSVFEESAKFCGNVLLPLNAGGDVQGCVLENGVVRTPDGFKEAYDLFSQSGWTALTSPPEFGGQGFPHSVANFLEEMVCSANLSFSLYPGLTHGAVKALSYHGSETLKKTYLPKMISGEWSGTMCLTESHCGTDLGLLRTRAAPQEDDSYKINGAKIFISAGDHDLSENIVHLVLARLPDAPKGIKGISLFLVPKFLPAEDGRAGPRNGVTCGSIEHKMGLKGSATCQLNFDDATGYLVGSPHKGMQAMFTMMNAARLEVGIQGLGIAEAAYQSAVFYARERLQGRSLAGPKYKDKPADPIIVHPDVRRMLMTMRAYTEGCRALGAWVSYALDRSHHAQTELERQEAEDFTALMTPVVKALFTDIGFEAANLCIQTHGGHGYIRDHGVEQFARDARIAMIYEGTNGIQALDLVGRKLPAHMGRSLRTFFHPVADFIETRKADAVLGPFIKAFEKSFGALQQATAFIAEKGLKDPEEAGAAASDYLRLFGLVALGFMWVRTAEVANQKLPQANGEAKFYQNKIKTAQFFIDRLLPQAGALYVAIKSGKKSMMSLDDDEF